MVGNLITIQYFSLFLSITVVLSSVWNLSILIQTYLLLVVLCARRISIIRKVDFFKNSKVVTNNNDAHLTTAAAAAAAAAAAVSLRQSRQLAWTTLDYFVEIVLNNRS